ncbi:hypothetical protein SAMN04487819_11164 [Actinopolyspora alba]|uniref:Zinc-finger n=1 Tax=Actinopolyspora alba TaxID=673379 RepID=A0A1I1ZPK5_9ACTN|nr:hypothetical protein [Actinopolyspora alba]SFE33268.1 hypothetical protein SAMN04487819_11164 [Actinopolyspora alba]
MSALSSLQAGRDLGRAAVERGSSVEISAETERIAVYWFTPEGDRYQHATVDALPTEGGGVSTLGGHDYAEARPAEDRRMNHVRPCCEDCFNEYLRLDRGQPSWKR